MMSSTEINNRSCSTSRFSSGKSKMADCSARKRYWGGTSMKIVVKVFDSRIVINGSGSSRKYILTFFGFNALAHFFKSFIEFRLTKPKSAISYGEFSRYSQKSLPSGFSSQNWRSFAILVLTPDFRKIPCCFKLVLLKYCSAYWMHCGNGCPDRWTFRTRETPKTP